MVMPKSYDDLVEKLAREREEGNKGTITQGATISGSSELPDGTRITIGPAPIYADPNLKGLPPLPGFQPKRRGRPPGSKNRSKEPK